MSTDTTGFGTRGTYVTSGKDYQRDTRYITTRVTKGSWLEPHGREVLGGHPFGDGTPPGVTSPVETVPSDHTPLR
jgi:putative glutathione S-transferase